MLEDTTTWASFSVDDVDRAEAFYGETLGLHVERGDAPGLRLTLPGGGRAFVYGKDDHVPATFTVLHFAVAGIDDAVGELAGAGIRFEQYPDLGTDERGIARSERGPAAAWFKDPAGNVLGLVEGM